MPEVFTNASIRSKITRDYAGYARAVRCFETKDQPGRRISDSGGSSNGAILITVYFHKLRTSQRLAQVRACSAQPAALVQLRTQMPDSDSSKFQPAAGSLHCTAGISVFQMGEKST